MLPAVLAHTSMIVMCVTHEMGLAREVADRIWFHDKGQPPEDAKPEGFLTSPQHPRAQGFLSNLRH